MMRSIKRAIPHTLAVLFILSAVAFTEIPSQERDDKYVQYREKLDKLKTMAIAKMRRVRDRANERFLDISKGLENRSPEEIGKWLHEHRSEEAQARQILEESAKQREVIYREFSAERERLESVYKAGGLGKVGYIFIGDVEYNASRRPLEAWHAGLKNLITFGWVTGNEPSKLEDFEPLIRKKEEMMGKKFETIITVYLARGQDLTKALADPDTAGYVWISHGGRDKREVYDDNGDPVSAQTFGPLLDAARDRYIKEKLPENLAKIYAETQSPDEGIAERARAKLEALSGEERELYDYIRDESKKVTLDLSYVEHYACLSGAEGAQKIADILVGKNGVFVGYKGVMDHTGEANRVTFRGRTSSPTEFKPENSADPDPRETIRQKRAGKGQKTKIEVVVTPVPSTDKKANDWTLEIRVRDINEKAVTAGCLAATTDKGGLDGKGKTEWETALQGGEARVVWSGPADMKDKATVEIRYLGDEKDPAKEDKIYAESKTSVQVPPEALETKVEVQANPAKPDPKSNDWKLDILVKDVNGKPVEMGDLKITAGDGGIEKPGALEWAGTLKDGRAQVTWFGPADKTKKVEITLTYLGDKNDPATPDSRYKDSEKTFSLPPELALTSIEVKVDKVDPNNPKSNDWAMEIEVKEESGAYVSLGDLRITCDEGDIEAKGQTTWSGALTGGKATAKWLGPDDPQKKAVVTIKYLGDQKDPALPDLKYGEAEKVLKMPPRLLKPTTVNITPSLVDEKKKIWKLETEVKDDKGVSVSKGAVRYIATGGSFKDASLVLDVQMTLQNGKYTKAWKQTDDDVQTITAKYLGDEPDPAKEDVLYEESKAAIKLPPELLEKSTVFVIDASGSMAGAKLASAKEAVRAALAGYMGKENKEEWALYAFFDCGSIQLLQGFTRDPAKIAAQMGFDASGSTPIAASIRAARNYLLRAARGKTGRIILLSDGGENCSGTPVEEAKSIRVRTLTVDLGK